MVRIMVARDAPMLLAGQLEWGEIRYDCPGGWVGELWVGRVVPGT
jgi:hypothetical protein